MKQIRTLFGTVVEDDDLDHTLNGDDVVWLDDDGAALVTYRAGRYIAQWVDEQGQMHSKEYACKSPAIRKAAESWGR